MVKRTRVDMRELKLAVDRMDERADRAIRVLFGVQASRSETYMRTNAPWTDRTGNARNGLHTVETHEDDSYRLILSHSVPYGIYLETMNAGEFEIIVPSVIRGADELWRSLSKLFELMKES